MILYSAFKAAAFAISRDRFYPVRMPKLAKSFFSAYDFKLSSTICLSTYFSIVIPLLTIFSHTLFMTLCANFSNAPVPRSVATYETTSLPTFPTLSMMTFLSIVLVSDSLLRVDNSASLLLFDMIRGLLGRIRSNLSDYKVFVERLEDFM